MTTGDIQAHLAEIYGTDISRDTICRITDAVVEDMVAWQNRPLDRVYPVILIDAIVVKIRDGQVANRPVYVAMGINLDGRTRRVGDVGRTHRRGGRQVLDDRAHRAPQPGRRRRLHRVLRRAEGPPGVDPGHLAAGRRPAVRRASRPLEPALHVQEALGAGLPGDARDLHRPHRRRRRGPLRRVRRHLARALPGDDRHLASGPGASSSRSSTSPSSCAASSTPPTPSESLNARFRKAVRHRGHFPNEQAALKVLYLVATEHRPNRSNPTGRINGWKTILNALTIHYGDRIEAAS